MSADPEPTEVPVIKAKPFYIVLGDLEDFLEMILRQPGAKEIMRKNREPWSLYKTEKGLFWFLEENAKSIVHQFMWYRNPTIYVIVNYRNKKAMDELNHFYEMIKKMRGHPEKKVVILGMKRQEIKMHRDLKKKILTWLISKDSELKENGQGSCDYMDYEDLDLDDI